MSPSLCFSEFLVILRTVFFFPMTFLLRSYDITTTFHWPYFGIHDLFFFFFSLVVYISPFSIQVCLVYWIFFFLPYCFYYTYSILLFYLFHFIPEVLQEEGEVLLYERTIGKFWIDRFLIIIKAHILHPTVKSILPPELMRCESVGLLVPFTRNQITWRSGCYLARNTPPQGEVCICGPLGLKPVTYSSFLWIMEPNDRSMKWKRIWKPLTLPELNVQVDDQVYAHRRPFWLTPGKFDLSQQTFLRKWI